MDRYDEAIALYKEVSIKDFELNVKTGYAEYYMKASIIQSHLGNYDRAISLLQEALTELPLVYFNDKRRLTIQVYQELARLYSEQGDYKSAYEYSSKVSQVED